ncbi:hypothetical protein [Neotabrizicola sp. VNH66]|uniref:hypothetical protein n=1 Tax=Neotabrizicola sp. VNH66 TaxID=3400918 RepID=UPI003BFEE12E
MSDDLISRAEAAAAKYAHRMDEDNITVSAGLFRAITAALLPAPAVDASGTPIGSHQAGLPSSAAQQAPTVEAEPVACRYRFDGGKWNVQKRPPSWFDPERDIDVEFQYLYTHPSDAESLRGEVAEVRRQNEVAVAAMVRSHQRAEKAEAERDAALARVAEVEAERDDAMALFHASDRKTRDLAAQVQTEREENRWAYIQAAMEDYATPPDAELDERDLRKMVADVGAYIREGASVPDIYSGGWKHPFSVTFDSDQLRAFITALRARKGGAE